MSIDVLLLDKSQLANVLSLAPRVAEQLMDGGLLPVVEVDGHKRVRIADVEHYVAALPLAGTQ